MCPRHWAQLRGLERCSPTSGCCDRDSVSEDPKTWLVFSLWGDLRQIAGPHFSCLFNGSVDPLPQLPHEKVASRKRKSERGLASQKERRLL